MRASNVDGVQALLWVAIPAAPLAAGLFARTLMAAPSPGLAVDFAQPLVVVTAWGAFGATLFGVLAAGMSVSALALALLCRRAARGGGDLPGGRGGLAAIGLCAALGLAAALSWPCMFSSDVYAYAAYGDQAIHGQNPYRPAPPAAHDAYLDAARWQWTRTSFPACVYGPLFVAASAAAVALSGGRIVPTLWLLRLAACAGMLVALILLDAVLAGAPRRRIKLAAFALNPVLLWSAAEGHNDTFVVAAVLGAMLPLRRGRSLAAGVLVAATPLVKAIGLLAAPAAWAYLQGEERKRFGLAAGLGALVIAAIVLPLQLGGLGSLAQHGRYTPQYSLQGLIGTLPALAVAALLGLTAVGDLRRRRFAGVVRFALALWLAIPNPYPWYALWIAPVAAAATWTWESAALLGATFSILARYLPEAYGDMPRAAGLIVASAELLPFLLLLRSAALWPLRAPRTGVQ